MGENVDFKLYSWLMSNAPKAVSVLGGSATPSLSLKEIVSLSNDPESTKSAFDYTSVPLGLASAQGKLELRQTVASTYDKTLSRLAAENVIIANGTTGANHIVHRALLKPGDHVIAQYPTYGPLIEEPRHIGCDISYLRLDPAKSWQVDLEELRRLIRPNVTKLLILNNPSNPTGTYFTTETQKEILKIAQENNLIVHCDEIFRPLFYPETSLPASLNEHLDTLPSYHNIITTSSLSKAYGLSGIRIGWITTRNPALLQKFMHMRLYTMQAASIPDEMIATEVLGPRCRSAILNKHYVLAKTNLDLIQSFIDRNSTVCEWTRPTAGAVAFVKIRDPKTGEEVDDVAFGQRLLERKKVALSPASLCFEIPEGKDGDGDGDESGKVAREFRGRFRVHFTAETESVRRGLELIEEFLGEGRGGGWGHTLVDRVVG